MGTPGESSRHWRGQYWRREVRTAVGIVVAAGVALAFFARELGFILIASAAVAFPVWLVMEDWLALGAQEPKAPMREFWRNRLFAFVAFTSAFAFGLFSYRRDRFDWGVLPTLLPVVIGFAVRTLYAWRDQQSRSIGLLDAPLKRISFAEAFLHFASYAIMLAAGLFAAANFDSWSSRVAAYASAALLAKLAVDFLFTKPAPLDDRALSTALMRMTVISPLWWGLPWGLLVAGYFLTIEHRPGRPIGWSIIDNLPIIYHVVIATAFVFAAVTAVAFLRESRRDRAWASASAEDGAMSSGDLAKLYGGVLALSFAAYALVFVPFWRSAEDDFGVETWTCAHVDDGWTLGWIAKQGIQIRVHGYIDLFDISCVPRTGRDGCEYDDEGWDEVETIVRGNDGSRTIVAFNRKSPGVKADLRHHAYLYGELGNEFLWALYDGARADMNIKAPHGRLLYAVHMDLRGYNKAFNACRARWLKEGKGR